MKEFLENLKRQAEANPMMALYAGAAVITAIAVLVRAHGDSAGSRAYARQTDYRIKHNR